MREALKCIIIMLMGKKEHFSTLLKRKENIDDILEVSIYCEE